MKNNKEKVLSKRAQRRLFTRQFYRGNRLNFFLAFVATIMQSAAALGIAWILQQVLDTAAGVEGALSLKSILIISVIILAVMVLFGMLLSYAGPRFRARAMKQYKEYAFNELTKKGISAFNAENSSVYISALSNDSNSIETNYLEQIVNFVGLVICFVGAFIMMALYSPTLTLVAFLFSLLPVLASVLAGNRMAEAEQRVSDRNAGFISMLKDSLTGFSVIKSFKAEKQIIEQFVEHNSKVEDAKRRRNRLEIVISLLGETSGGIAQIGVFLVGAYLALHSGEVTVGGMVMFVQLMNYVLSPIAQIPVLMANRKASNALIDKLADAVCSNVRDEGEDIAKELSSGIEFKNVSFAYEADNPVLHNIDVQFDAGKSCAIVGASGSGKSTMLNLLMAGHSNYDGEILFDGKELRTISASSLYDVISIVQQNVFVFNSSIRDNITMFSDFDPQEVDRAIELSGLAELIAERGEDYLCGENGSGLSGGEKQRISIARCILRRTPVMLIDEATAALDAETAFRISGSILDLDGLTRIVVTHALDEALLSRYDSIIALKNGKIAECGTFEQLMERKGYFYSLFTVSQ